ncbi:MAG: sigma-54-dependent Fis family transcriptional regulator [Phycisphaerae bacterium]|nr:sigma-54-dependent Fis family transcriptional regulator [Phycisphaerae bacterium]
MARVCIIDDQEVMRDSLADILGAQGHEATAYADPHHALREVSSSRFDTIVSDLKMPGMDGIELLRALRSRGVETPFVLMTAYASVPTAVEAMKVGAFDYIQKPFEADQIGLVVDRAVTMGRLRGENEALRASLHDLEGNSELVGSGRAMRQVRSQIDRVARSQATVLIQGESGTGKELVARAIRAASPRSGGPMMCVNCAALSPTLLESELFGHERGAFTGADKLRKGRFELAMGGTLLLDEISEVPLPLQAKLLRVLQEREFERVGSSSTMHADVRVIATTNRDLSDWVSRRRFREDLFFRVSVLPMLLPPLRDRREDIPELVDYFLRRITRREGRGPTKMAPPALNLLANYHWPGNVRELQNVCERAVVLCQDETIDNSLIEPWLSAETTIENVSRPVRPGHLMEDMERALIEKTLLRFNGHRVKTAKALGIGVRTLGMRLKRWREEAALQMQQSQQRRAG